MKERILTLTVKLAALAFVLLLAQGCPRVNPEEEEEQRKIAADPEYAAKDFLRSQYMDVFYYWRDQVMDRNATLKPYDYPIEDFFDKMLYSGDRWSWMCDKEEYVSGETGVIQGTWGVSLGQAIEYYNDYGIRVRYIYPGSPFEKYGVTRGAIMTEIAGKNIADDEEGFTKEKLNIFNENYNKTPQSFKFRLTDGSEVSFTASMVSSLSTRTSLITRIIQPSEYPGLTEPVGYFLYMSFKANFLDDINRAMTSFHDAGVHSVIVDLRYNGGGDARASQLLVDYLAPLSAVGKPYVVRKHNSYLASLNEAYSDEKNTATVAGNENSLSLDKLYFIVGGGTASASEMVINGLEPYYREKQQMVGDTTYGKPNGMYVLMYPGLKADYEAYNKGDYSNLEWVFLPICFYNENSEGKPIDDNGFVPNLYRPDDLYHDFGVDESSIAACLEHIVSGTYPSAIPGSPRRSALTKSAGKGQCRIETEENRPEYGSYRVQGPIR